LYHLFNLVGYGFRLFVSNRSYRINEVFQSLSSQNTRSIADLGTATFVAEDLPLLMVSVSKESTCHELIEKSGELALNVACADQVDLARKLGATHGRDVDKFETFGVQTEPPPR